MRHNVEHPVSFYHPVTGHTVTALAVCDQPESATGFVLHAVYLDGEDITDLTNIAVWREMSLTEFLEQALCTQIYGEP